MKLKLERYRSNDKATLGTLSLDGHLFCWTLEDVDRYLETNPGAKIPGATAIPRGSYKVVIDFSAHFGKPLPHVINVPGFEGVRIHSGNSDADTEGCVLVGGKPTGPDFIPNSRQTFNKLFALMEEAENNGEQITLEVA